MPIFSTNTRYHRPPTKKQRVQAQQQHNIPHKAPTKAQESFRRKKKRLSVKRKSAPNVPFSIFKQNEEAREQKEEEYTKEVIKQRQEQWNNIPVYYRDDIDINMNETISNNDRNHNNRRITKPSQAMKTSKQYMNKSYPSHNDIDSDSD